VGWEPKRRQRAALGDRENLGAMEVAETDEGELGETCDQNPQPSASQV